MKRQFCLVATGALLSLASPLSASDWFYLGVTGAPDGRLTKETTFWSADRESLRRVGSIAYIWIRHGEVAEDADETHTVARMYYRVDCSAQTLKILSDIAYDKQGAVTYSKSSHDTSYGADPVVPDSMGEAIAKIACN